MIVSVSRCVLAIAFLAVMQIAIAQTPTVYSPFKSGRLEWFTGYCKTAAEERKLWSEVNQFAKSFLFVAPQVPPDQKAYIQAEISSGNNERALQVTSSSFYKIDRIIENVKNIEGLSALYLAHAGSLPIEKKVEIIGRSLLNLDDDQVPFADIDSVSGDLKRRGYSISADTLRTFSGNAVGIKRVLQATLICYGENYRR